MCEVAAINECVDVVTKEMVEAAYANVKYHMNIYNRLNYRFKKQNNDLQDILDRKKRNYAVYLEKNREEINRKKREAYQLKKDELKQKRKETAAQLAEIENLRKEAELAAQLKEQVAQLSKLVVK